MPKRRAAPVLIALAMSALLLAVVLWRAEIRSDLVDFLPTGQTPAARAALAALRDGAAAGLVLVAIEGAAEDELARISRFMQDNLTSDGRFSRVAGGEAAWSETAEEALFARRYLLSPITRREIFEPAALRQSLEDLLRTLRSSAGPLVARYVCLLYTSPSPRDGLLSRMPSSA